MNSHDPFLIFTTPVPALGIDVAERVLHDNFMMSGALTPLASERDQNFLVAASDGNSFVLKIANSAESPSVTDFQSGALLHIADTAPELAVPRLVKTRDGQASVSVTALDGREHVVRLITWLDGTPLQQHEGDTRCADLLGTCLAGLGQSLRTYEHPASDHALLWDLKQAAALRELLDSVHDPALRRLCSERLDAFDIRVEPRLNTVRWQVIHNDLNPSNVLVDENSGEVVGVIDFGDMVRSPLVVDVAVAAAYLLRDDDDPLADVVSFVQAYSAVEPLDGTDIDLLFDLVLTRATMTVLITHWRATQYPENRDYILRNEARARRMLGLMSGLSTQEVTRRLRCAAVIE
jgi:Ser/Thr protein kinase RdoA (MazF antagonist)